MSTPDKKYLNAFNLLPSIGPQRLRRLCAHFPSLSEAWRAGSSELRSAGLEEKIVRQVVEGRTGIDPESEWEKLAQENINILTENEPAFPRKLREIASAPMLLYYKGEIKPDEFCLGIVGSRKISPYGRRAAEYFASGLARSGLTVVSGMAYGVDTAAHRTALDLQRRTIAVLGGGLDSSSIYPAANRKLSEEIENCGCLLSEYPLGTPPLRRHFPARNRLISGLSAGVLVVEAAENSASLITARFALEQNREVFAVPGSIFAPNSVGANNLIRLGAKAVSRVEDILEEFHLACALPAAPETSPASPEEELVLEHLTYDQPLHVDQLARTTGLKTSSLSSLLTLMEMKGMVKDLGAMHYVKK